MDPLLVGYVMVTALLVVTPGSTTAVVVRNTLAGGRGAGVAAAAGAALANTSHATAAGLGLAVVLARWPVAMTIIRVAGAAYLAWLGLVSVYRVARHADGGMRMLQDVASSPAAERARHTQLRSAIGQGLTVNLLNPAIAAFYLTIVPQFMRETAPRWYFAALAAIHIVMALVCHGLWALALDALRHFFRPPLARRALEAATGVALVVLAVRVLLG